MPNVSEEFIDFLRAVPAGGDMPPVGDVTKSVDYTATIRPTPDVRNKTPPQTH
jgi:hypothetical protein